MSDKIIDDEKIEKAKKEFYKSQVEPLLRSIEIPLNFKPIKLTKKDLEFIEFREITEKQIMGRK